ncbi:MAG: hypothetical protein ACP5MV_03725 [Candidatus Parvarchaeum sp.]
MAIKLSYDLKKRKYKSLEINLSELEKYKIVLKYPNKIKNGDIVLNAGLTEEISPEIYKGRFTKRFLSDIYGIYINKELDKSPYFNEIYKIAKNAAANKNGLERALAIADSFYVQMYYRLVEYTDNYSKEKGLMTNEDLLYLEGNDKRSGKAISTDYSLIHGHFLCHEFAIALSVLLDKEKRRTGLKPFYVMGIVEKDGEKAEHCWLELKDRKGKRILLDRLSNVAQPLKDGQRYVVSDNGVKYWIDNGPLVLRRNHFKK